MLIVMRCLSRAVPAAHILVALVFMALSTVLRANTIVVNDASSGSVSGKCTIQDAVSAANTNAAVNGCTAGAAGADTITFAAGITTITLASAMASGNAACTFGLAVTEDLTVDGGAAAGSGMPKVVIQRSNAVGTPNFGIIGASLYNCGTIPSRKLNLTLAGVAIGNGNNTGAGGGVAADVLTVSDSAITGNRAASGGGVYAFSSLTMTTSTVSGNSGNFGGGIAGDVPLTISGSTINGNTGTGIYGQSSTIMIDNSTVSGNTSSGIDTGFITAYFVTITANTGPGIYLELATLNNSVAEFDDTLIAGNGSHDLETSASRPITGTYNYFGTVSTVGLNDLDSGARIPSCSPLNLGPLANNGGGTKTHALLAGSCLIDAGGIVSPGGFLFAHDQRGSSFPRFVNTRADIGAFEYQGGPASVNGACGSDNGQTLLTAPANLCSAGSASVVGGSGHPWSWTCAGSNGGTTASCSATIKTWTVTASAGTGGTVDHPSQTIDNGAIAHVTATAAPGSTLSGAGGCGGSLSANVYTTAAVVADCTITFSFTAQAKSVPSVSLTSSANPVVAGRSVTFVATVTGDGETPSGSIIFLDGTATLARAPIGAPAASVNATLNAAGQATFATSTLAVGVHTITAAYSGDTLYAAATSSGLVETVAAPTAQTTIAAPALSGWAALALVALFAGLATAQRKRSL